MTKARLIEAVRTLFGAIKRNTKLLDEALCDECPTCDGTVGVARDRLVKAANKAAQILRVSIEKKG